MVLGRWGVSEKQLDDFDASETKKSNSTVQKPPKELLPRTLT